VWHEQIFSQRRFDLVETRLTEACSIALSAMSSLSSHIKKQIVYSCMPPKFELWIGYREREEQINECWIEDYKEIKDVIKNQDNG